MNSVCELEKGIVFNVMILCDALVQNICVKHPPSSLLCTGHAVCKVGLFSCSFGVITFEHRTVTGQFSFLQDSHIAEDFPETCSQKNLQSFLNQLDELSFINRSGAM